MFRRRGTQVVGSCQRIFTTSSRRLLIQGGRRLVLGIESSCDDSCASLVSAPADYFRTSFQGAEIHNSIVLKQDHGLTRGIEPINAANAHSANVPLAIRKCLEQAEDTALLADVQRPVEIDAIAVTQGPGMGASLAQGMSCAKMLSTLWDRPIIYVHHMVAHTLTPFLSADQPIRMPLLVLLLSGGHTQLVLCQSPSQFKIIANSSDGSIGEAFDKVARMLEIDFDWTQTAPGAALEKFARPVGWEQFKLAVPFRNQPQFSYSGLKSYLQEKVVPSLTSEDERRGLAYAFQQAAFGQIQDKIRMSFDKRVIDTLNMPLDRALIQDLVISGGVASNQLLRQRVHDTLCSIKREDVAVHYPPIALCTDNAAMIAHAALISWKVTSDLRAKPKARWSVEDIEDA